MHSIILKNLQTGRYHPMTFHAAPRPSDDITEGGYCRHRSFGHHTEGFEDIEKAKAYIDDPRDDLSDTCIVLEWDGQGIPAMNLDLPLGKRSVNADAESDLAP